MSFYDSGIGETVAKISATMDDLVKRAAHLAEENTRIRNLNYDVSRNASELATENNKLKKEIEHFSKGSELVERIKQLESQNAILRQAVAGLL